VSTEGLKWGLRNGWVGGSISSIEHINKRRRSITYWVGGFKESVGGF